MYSFLSPSEGLLTVRWDHRAAASSEGDAPYTTTCPLVVLSCPNSSSSSLSLKLSTNKAPTDILSSWDTWIRGHSHVVEAIAAILDSSGLPYTTSESAIPCHADSCKRGDVLVLGKTGRFQDLVLYFSMTHPRSGASKLHPIGDWKPDALNHTVKIKDGKHAISLFSYEQGNHAFLSLVADTYGKISTTLCALSGWWQTLHWRILVFLSCLQILLPLSPQILLLCAAVLFSRAIKTHLSYSPMIHGGKCRHTSSFQCVAT